MPQIAVQKNEWEEKLSKLLEKVVDYLPTYTALERLSNDKNAAKKLAQIRDNVINFMTQAMMYYDSNGCVRTYYHIIHPRRSSSIETVRAEIDEDALFIWNFAMKKSEERIEFLEQTVKNFYLSKARACLRNADDADFRLTPEYETKLEQAARSSFDGAPFRFEEDLAKGEYEQWQTDPSSSIFILTGKSLHPRQTGVSWLSPAAFAVVRQFTSHERYVVASGTLQSLAYPPVHPSSMMVLSYLLLNLIEQQSDTVVVDVEFQRIIERPLSCKTLLDLWGVVLGHIPRVWLAIDRLDMCDGFYMSALKSLGAVVKAAGGRSVIKVFVVFGDLHELRLRTF